MGAISDGNYVSSYTGDEIDAALGKAASYPAASSGTTGQVPTKTADGIVWQTPAAGGTSTDLTVTLAAASWSSKTQTVSNAAFAVSGYSYIVAPASASYAAYASAQIYADDVTVAGSMTFHCVGDEPSSDLTVNILKVEVSG